MTTHYLDFTVLGMASDQKFLFNKLFTRLHGILSAQFSGDIGLAFPDYTEHSLGKCIRAFSTEKNLQIIAHQSTLASLAESNAIEITQILCVPVNTLAVRYIRDRGCEKQGKVYLARCKRRREKRNGTQMLEQSDSKPENLIRESLPYVQLQSSSNKYPFSLYVRKEPAVNAAPGSYSNYGLSKDGSTVPSF